MLICIFEILTDAETHVSREKKRQCLKFQENSVALRIIPSICTLQLGSIKILVIKPVQYKHRVIFSFCLENALLKV